MFVVEPLAGARIVGEHQRLDGHRHSARRQADLAEIDIVEIPQHHAVYHQHTDWYFQLVLKDMAKRLRDIAVEHDEQRLSRGDHVVEAQHQPFSEGVHALIRRHTLPVKRQGNFTVGSVDLERRPMGFYRPGHVVGDDLVRAVEGRLDDLQVAPRQKFCVIRHKGGVA